MSPIIAVDPGASGGIVFLNGSHFTVMTMPPTEGGIIEAVKRFSSSITTFNPPPTAYIEQLVKHMGAGIPASTMAVYAANWGIVVGALMMANWRVEFVRPQDWQKALGLGVTGRQRADVKGMTPEQASAEKKRVAMLNQQLKRDWKNKLLGTAQRLFPGVAVTLKTADALLIAEYGRRQQH